jgi:hypothetical protein
MGGCQYLFRILKQPDLFLQLPFNLKRAILDLLTGILQKNIYNVVRLQFSDNVFSTAESCVFCKIFLRLLEVTTKQENPSIILNKKIIRLLGLASSIGMSPTYMRKFLVLLRSSNELTLSLLHSMNSMFNYDQGTAKAFPPSFFTFGGPGSGLFTSLSHFPFTKEYQVVTWFRSEDIPDSPSSSSPTPASEIINSKAFNCGMNGVQHLITWQNPAQKGLDVFIDGNILIMAISNHSKTEPTLIRLTDQPLRKGHWYHFSLRHSKPKNFFSSDELAIHLDQEMVYTDNFRFPNLGNLIDTDFAIGRNFNGQIGPVYFFNDALHASSLSAIAKLDAGRGLDSYNVHSSLDPSTPSDLIKSVLGSDRKLHSINSKITMSYHPSRCHHGFAIDIHSGRHAAFGNFTQPWNLVNPRELFVTLGGISCLLPLFPKLLIENDVISTTNVVLSSSKAAITNGGLQKSPSGDLPPAPSSPTPSRPKSFSTKETGAQLLDESVVNILKFKEDEELSGVGYICLLVSIIAKCIKSQKVYQQQLFDEGGIEMIEYVFQCVSPELLEMENDRCVSALSQLKLSANEHLLLEMKIMKCLLCNVKLWFHSSFQFLINLLPLIIAELKAKPERLSKIFKIDDLLEHILLFQHIEEEDEVDDELREELVRKNQMSTEDFNNASAELLSNASTENISVKRLSRTISEDLLPHNNSSSGGVRFSAPSSRDHSERNVENSSSNKFVELPISRQTSEGKGSIGGEFSVASPTVSFRSANSGHHHERHHPQTGGTSYKRMKSFKLALTEVMIQNDEDEEAEEENIRKSIIEETTAGGRRPSVAEEGLVVRRPSLVGEDQDSNNPSLHNNSDLKDTVVNLSEALQEDNGHPRLAVRFDEDSQPHQEEEAAHEDEYEMEEEIKLLPKTNYQRKQIRDYLFSMIIILVKYGNSEKEILPLIEFLTVCKNKILLNEMANVFLYLMNESSSKIVSAIISSCSGVEEFISFILVYLIHQPYEELRCTGMRIITYFYSKSELHSLALSGTYFNQKKKRKFIASMSGQVNVNSKSFHNNLNNLQGLQRLQLCGGLALLCEIISSHIKFSSESTYSAIIELLLTKANILHAIKVQYSEAMDQIIANSLTSSSGGNQGRIIRSGSMYSPMNANSINDGNNRNANLMTVAQYLSVDGLRDEGSDMTNSYFLPIFFELLPKLPLRLHELIYGDLLALLKHSEGNRNAFIACPSWHLCMFGLVIQLVDSTIPSVNSKSFHTYEMMSEIESFTGIRPSQQPGFDLRREKSSRKIQELQLEEQNSIIRSWQHRYNNSPSKGKITKDPLFGESSYDSNQDFTVNKTPNGSPKKPIFYNNINSAHESTSHRNNFNLWFDIGMKIYSTLLLHAIEYKNGFKEIDRAISSSFNSEIGYSISQTILSHLLNDLTFIMKSKYKELQRLVRSTNTQENQSATEKLENFLSILLTSSDLALINQQVVFNTVPDQKISLQRIQTYNELSKDLKNSRAEKTVEIEGNISFTDKEVMLPFSTLELRGLLNETEIKVREKLENPETSIPFDENLDLFHIWYDISTSDTFLSSQTTDNGGQSVAEKLRKAENLISTNANQIFKTTEELLHPLERVHEIYHGKLILVLQSLRFFDVIFWPTEESTIRNNDMLRFSKELFKQQQQPAETSNKSSQSQQQNADLNQQIDSSMNSSKTENPKKQMSIFSSTMRMCIFTLIKLSPSTHLAVHNIKRMRALIRSLDRVSPYNTPTYDWLLAGLAHVTLNIQRLLVALEPAFEMIGVKGKTTVPSVGPWNESYDDFDKLSNEDNENIFLAMANPDLLQSLHQYFNSSPARNLVRNLRSSLHFLMDAFTLHSGKLSSSLEERCYRSLWILVEQMRADTQIVQQLPQEMISSTSSTTIKSLKKYNSMNRFDVNYSVDSGAGDIYESSSNVTASGGGEKAGNGPNSPMNTFMSAIRGRSQSEQSDNPNVQAEPSPKNSRDGRSGSFTFEMSGVNNPSNNEPNLAGNTNNPTTNTGSSAGGGGLGGLNSDSFIEETFNGYDILMMLKWLRYPYFKSNIFRNIQIIKSLQALDYLEGRSIYRFSWETQTYKQELEDHRDLAIKFMEEMTELKELSREVNNSIIQRYSNGHFSKYLQENLKVKKVAKRWNDCLEYFELDWSIWKKNLSANCHDTMILMNQSDSPHSLHGIAYYELAKHRDGRFRNMLMVKLSEPIDHKENAYLDSKFKDQMLFLSSTSHSNSVEGNAPHFDHLAIQDDATNSSNAATDEGKDNAALVVPSSSISANTSLTTATPSTAGTVLVKWKMPQTPNNPKTSSAAISSAISSAIIHNTKNDFDVNFDESTDELDDNRSDSNKSDLTNLSTNNEGGTIPSSGTNSLTLGVGLAAVVGFFQGNEEKSRPLWTHLFHWQTDEKTLFVSDVTRIQLDQIVAGSLILTNRCIYFHYKKRLGGLGLAKAETITNTSNNGSPNNSNYNSTHPNTESSGNATTHHLIQSDKRWYLDRVTELYGRRYLSQNCAIELFFANAEEVFLAFPSFHELAKFFKILRSQHTPLLQTSRSLNPRYIYSHSHWTELWKKRQISNFEYLMKLNIIAGRSYNDITQYPVYPWILSNYTSEHIDLTDRSNYRDLSKPMGALNEDRLKEFKERYNTFYDDTIPKFMYGSHYSSAGVVLHYMVRQEPYTTLAINLQSGRFDCPDRIFFNISKTWNGCNHSMSDVKELIPEMYYCPEIFVNSNRLPLGELQDGNVVDHVILPTWCYNDPFEFIRIHREALESDYVSEHLHEWIDLIFGYKQRGEASLTANNVFYYLTYENAIDISAIEDPLQRAATKSQVIHFGQTPSQLLNREHPKRQLKEDCPIPLCSDINTISRIQIFTPYNSLMNKNNGAILCIRCIYDKLFLFHQNYTLEMHRWNAVPDHGDPFTLKFEKLKLLGSGNISTAGNLIKEIQIIHSSSSSSFTSGGSMSSMQAGSSVTMPSKIESGKKHEDETVHQQQQSPAHDSHPVHRMSIDNSRLESHHHTPSRHHKVKEVQGEDNEIEKPATNRGSLSSDVEAAEVTDNVGDKKDVVNITEEQKEKPQEQDRTQRHSKSSLVKKVQFEAAADSETNDLVSPPQTNPANRTTRAESVNLSVFSTLKNSFFGNRKKSASIASNHEISPMKDSSHDSKTTSSPSPAASTSLYNAMRIDQKLNPDKKLQSPHHHHHTHHQQHHHHSHSTLQGSSSRKSSVQQNSILDTCSNGLLPFSARLMTIHDGENLSQARIVTAGYWDNTIKVHSLNEMKEIISVNSGHLGSVTCLENGGVQADGNIIVTGGFDGTIRVWVLEKPALATAFRVESFYAEPLPTIEELNQVNPNSSSATNSSAHPTGTLKSGSMSTNLSSSGGVSSGGMNENDFSGASSSLLSCIYVLVGHSSPIASLSYCVASDMVFSGGSDGLLCLHTVRQGQYIRCMTEMIGSAVDVVLATNAGYLVAHSWTTLQTYVFWVNGQTLVHTTLQDKIECLIPNQNGTILIMGFHSGVISFRKAWNLEEIHRINLSMSGCIKSLNFSEGKNFVFCFCYFDFN